MTEASVEVWTVSLEALAPGIEQWHTLLGEDEKKRAARIRIERARRQFIIARGVLRELLANYLRRQAREIMFTYGPHGKPLLPTTENPKELHFSLSHSHGLAVFAFTERRELGVDVERVRDKVPCEALARRYFSPRETAELMSLPPVQRRRAFFHCWTRKEAFIKAKGMGLALPLNQFEVVLAPNVPAALRYTAWDPSEASQWRLVDLRVHDDYAAALAVRAPCVRVVMKTRADAGHAPTPWHGHATV